MPTRISTHDVTDPHGPTGDTGPRRTGVDVLKYRESHNGKAPPRDGAAARPLSGIELFKYREAHGGLTPEQVAAKEAELAAGSRR